MQECKQQYFGLFLGGLSSHVNSEYLWASRYVKRVIAPQTTMLKKTPLLSVVGSKTGDGQSCMVFAKAICAQQEEFSPWDPADPFRRGCGRQLRQVSYKP